ncbi:hypothetical protein WG68_05545 [Arsukibacterium ikkense]|uniref:Uncharacterized protein n=1 Tax=Arsukibacterium ikkense TaxID=336831 RepID=A0A0M2VAS7_9GAMM|nr:hypothetical protein [Arsukibacterium ikkense]KKO46238.1 hypothetical protein WG68_05545 [Arsukibacterium ikkense]
MLKLSRRNWNNVLIFAVLILMFVLYGIPQRLQQKMAPEHRLIPADSQLLMVGFASARLVKAGPQWQLQPATHNVDAAQLALAWQYSQLIPADAVPMQSRVPVAQASVQLVGETSPIIWLLYPGDDPANAAAQARYLLQQAGQSQFYQLSKQQAAQLFMLE